VRLWLGYANGRGGLDALWESGPDPATTGVRIQILDANAQGRGKADQFVKDQGCRVSQLTVQVQPQQPAAFDGLSAQMQVNCPRCQYPLVRRKNPYGYFWGCRNYPDCQVIVSDEHGKPGTLRQPAQATGEACPECGQGQRVERIVRKGQRRGQTFIGCSRFPACAYTEYH